MEVSHDGAWKALALGDCCLFHERGTELIAAFPLVNPECFSSRPVLIPSLPRAIDEAVASLKTCSGQLENGDLIWLMSDAIAAWYLANRNGKPGTNAAANRLASAILAGDPEMATLVQNERWAGRLRNDDVALLYIEAIPFPHGAE
jgi:hypothetical protein